MVKSQQVNVAIRLLPDAAGRVVVEGSCAPAKVWSFRDNYAGILGLGTRIEGLKLFDANGAGVNLSKIAPGQFESVTPASRFRYEVNLAPRQGADAARVSWLNAERGLLMLSDLLPVFQSQAEARSLSGANGDSVRENSAMQVTVSLDLPGPWTARSNESQNASGEFEVTDADRAVFVIGKHLRTSQTAISGMMFSLVADGDWAFADKEALELAGKVLKVHGDLFGSMPSKRAMLALFPFPQTVAADKWSAETRGSTVTLLLGKLPSKNGALAQLSVPVTHELFHLWVPNALALNGDYDWFYEGFTIYQAARTAVRLQLLTFQEFLNALGRAYDAYAASADRDRWSLVEASQRRWTVGESVVYQKSMLVAFLYDLNLRNRTHGKHSLDDVYHELFRQYRLAEGAARRAAKAGRGSGGNEVVISALSDAAVMQDFAGSFIRRPAVIDLQAELAPFGFRVERLGLRTRVSVNEVLTRQQRDLLRDLGYNDYARPPTQKRR